jgi:hypothetical protein
MPVRLNRQSDDTSGQPLMAWHGNTPWPPWLSFNLRDKIEERTGEHAICTLPAPADPLSLDAPMPGMASVWCVNDIGRFVGKAVAGWAYNQAIPLIFNNGSQAINNSAGTQSQRHGPARPGERARE